jgi:2'-5' RNA ligase
MGVRPVPPSMLRAFIAISLPDDIVSQLDRIQRRLQRTCPDRCIRWVNPHTIHLTLYFIAELPESHVAQVKQVLSEMTVSIPVFNFTVENLGTFPNQSRPNVIWIGVGNSKGKLNDLHKAVNEGMARIGLPVEKRAFTPHLTIGRVNRRVSREDRAIIGLEVTKLSVGSLGTVEVSEVVLYRSTLKHSGAEHIVLAKFPLETFSITSA